MSQDTLSDVLRAVRLHGAVFYYIDGRAPWVAEAPPTREIIPGIMPGTEHLIEFHGVVAGSCWAAVAGESPIRLDEGDVILFPQGDPHVLSSAPDMRAPEDDREVVSPRPAQLPYRMRLPSEEATTAGLDADGDRSTIVCGFLGLDARPFNPLLTALPRVLHVSRAALGPDSWASTMLRAVVVESSQRKPGGEAVLARMSELLFVEALRRYVDGLPRPHTGWLAGVRDRAVGRVLALLHDKPEAEWTLERLAEESAMSRSMLQERFVQFIGQPPMHYLTQWRMQVAAGMLRDTKAKLIAVALASGYDSEATFSRAFKREVGVAPAAFRSGKSPAKGPG